MGTGVNTLWRAALLAAALAPAAAPAADDYIYHYREGGVRVYTDQKPEHKNYALIARFGRPTATASCVGLTEAMMEERRKAYAPLIQKYAVRNELSPSLVSAVMRVESCYDHRAVSKSGARGLMQLMPETARELGVHDSFDPEQNISGGVRYLARMLKRFNNDLRLGLAAYNAGPGTVDKHQGVPPLPHTVSYVSRILKLYQPPG